MKVGDVLLKLGSTIIGNDGSIELCNGNFNERVHYSYLLSQLSPNDVVICEVLRDGARYSLPVKVSIPQKLIPRNILKPDFFGTNENTSSSILGRSPSYCIIGGLVFISLTREYVDAEISPENIGPQNFGLWSTEFEILSKVNSISQKDNEEIVLLSQVISHSCNMGYESISNLRLRSLQGKTIENLRQLHEYISFFFDEVENGIEHDSIVFEFSNGQVIVVGAKDALAAQSQVSIRRLNYYNIYSS